MKTKRRWAIAGIVIGGLFAFLGPMLGLLGTVFGMSHAFNALGNSGVGDPRVLTHHIGAALLSTATGFLLFPFGVIILILSIVFYIKIKQSLPPPLPADPRQPPADPEKD